MEWREGRLVFSGQRLATVLAELGRYRHGRIVLRDARAGQRLVTGVFDPHDTDARRIVRLKKICRVTSGVRPLVDLKL